MSDPIKTEEWLYQWLQPVIPIQMIQIMNRTYLIVFHFRIAFYVHLACYDVLSKEYLWYVVENQALYEESFHCSKRYSTLEAMIKEVAQHFRYDSCHSISLKSP